MTQKSKYEYNKEYAKDYLNKLDEIKIRVPKGQKDVVREHAQERGESVQGFIKRAISETIERDKKSSL
jgi:predicted DNA binding CopG/RHH family protein